MIDEIITKIEKILEKNIENINYIGISYGKLGYCIFLNYLSYIRIDFDYRAKAEKILEDVFYKLNNGYISETIYLEISELGQYLIQASNNNWINIDLEENLTSIDALMLDLMSDAIKKRDFDPVTGVLNQGYYFLERSQHKDKKNIIHNIIEFLIEISIKSDKGVYWESKLKEDDSIYLGISHGSSSIILFIIYCINAGYYPNNTKVENTILGACEFILSHAKKENHLIFPVIVGKDETRLISKNYCYGDFGTLYGLFFASRYYKHDQIYNQCIDFFKITVEKGYDSPYLDAGSSLLYGDAGLAMLFRKFNKISNKDCFASSYNYMINKILNKYDKSDEYLGFRGYWNQEEANINYSFNEGLIGIGLELITYKYGNIAKNIHDIFFHLK